MSSLSELKSCAVCFNDFDMNNHLPRTLPCAHTFCHSCLVAIKNQNQQKKCPTCNSKIARNINIDSLPRNLTIISLMDIKIENSHTESKEVESKEVEEILVISSPEELIRNRIRIMKALEESIENPIFIVNFQLMSRLQILMNVLNKVIQDLINNKMFDKAQEVTRTFQKLKDILKLCSIVHEPQTRQLLENFQGNQVPNFISEHNRIIQSFMSEARELSKQFDHVTKSKMNQKEFDGEFGAINLGMLHKTLEDHVSNAEITIGTKLSTIDTNDFPKDPRNFDEKFLWANIIKDINLFDLPAETVASIISIWWGQSIPEGTNIAESLSNASFLKSIDLLSSNLLHRRNHGETLVNFHKNDNISIADLLHVFPCAEVEKALKISTKDFKKQGVSLSSMKEQSKTIPVNQMKNLLETYSIKELLQSNFPVKDILRKYPGTSMKDFVDNGYELEELRDAGFSAMQMRQCGVKLQRLIGLDYSLKEIKAIAPGWLWGGAASFKLEEFVAVGCRIDELLRAGFTISQLKSHFTCEQMRAAGVTLDEVLNIFKREDLILGGYSGAEIDQAKREIEERNQKIVQGVVMAAVVLAAAANAAEEQRKERERRKDDR